MPETWADLLHLFGVFAKAWGEFSLNTFRIESVVKTAKEEFVTCGQLTLYANPAEYCTPLS